MASKINNKNNNTKTSSRKRKEEENITFKEGLSWAFGALFFIGAIVLIISHASHLITWPHNKELNWFGPFGEWVSQQVFENGFGLATYFIVIFMFATSLRILNIGKIRLWKWFINCAFLMIWFSILGAYLQQFEPFVSHFRAGGIHGSYVLNLLKDNAGPAGPVLVLACSALVYIIYLSGEAARLVRRSIAAARRQAEKMSDNSLKGKNGDKPRDDGSTNETVEEYVPVDTATTIDFINDYTKEGERTDFSETEMEIEVGGETQSETESGKGEIVKYGTDEPEALPGKEPSFEPYDPKLDLENYKYPTLDLLKKYESARGSQAIDLAEQNQNKEQIITTLANFGVEISGIKATVGPTVTLYEITLAQGVRISKIRILEDDIALSLRALGIRIIAPMPGKGTVGIEVPNTKPQMVSMESLLNSRKFQETNFELPMALGKTITNEIFMVDLVKMPHLLVSGATGQGKSVGLNAIITSLLFKKHPAELKLVMIDPKKVEFSVYNPIVNHFLAQVEGSEDTDEPIITDVSKATLTLKSSCQEMETRFDLLKKSKTRNITEYNAKFKERKLNPENGHKFMPYIVIIIDEFADLIMTAGKEVELPITRIAQMGRAVGMHMIIATQRPSVNIITGTIKANFPARMAFKVSAAVDSKTILDRTGAHRLVGKGDMLFLAGSEPIRVQCAFVDTPEVENICNHIACQQSYNGPFLLPMVDMEGDGGGSPEVSKKDLDPMFEEVARFVVTSGQGSTSMIQRKYSIGYNRAGRLMDQLEKAGIVGPANGSKPRDVLCVSEQELEYKLNNMW